MRALHSAGVTVLGGPRAIDLGVVGQDKVSPGFKTEYGESLTCIYSTGVVHNGGTGYGSTKNQDVMYFASHSIVRDPPAPAVTRTVVSRSSYFLLLLACRAIATDSWVSAQALGT